MYKNFRAGEKWKAQLRGEAFNLFNHPRFDAPNTDPRSASFGVVSPVQLNQPRTIQLGLKISF